ncbi:MAG TPA: squalene synthase HpnC [Vicinamibacterales bacterium]|nr:squalene synthase HpnC [Vicinamibacterales bacterium]
MSLWPGASADARAATTTAPLAQAYAACLALARSHYENFPVASRLLPAPMRPHVAAVYAFARVADDIADEGTASPGERLARLRLWQERLHRAAGGEIDLGSAEDVGRGVDRDALITIALGHSIRSLDLPLRLFDDLLSAFGQDTMTTRYASWADVLDYCRRSANPVGRLVLRIAGYRDDALDRSSDALCTALQLTNFWQDFGRDWRAGRLYVPRDEQMAVGAAESELGAGRLGPAWCQALARCVAVTRGLFEQGRQVCNGVSGRLGVELRFTWLGGSRILDRVERSRDRLLSHRPTLGAADVAWLLWRAARWT